MTEQYLPCECLTDPSPLERFCSDITDSVLAFMTVSSNLSIRSRRRHFDALILELSYPMCAPSQFHVSGTSTLNKFNGF